jgi:hypothetical protein
MFKNIFTVLHLFNNVLKTIQFICIQTMFSCLKIFSLNKIQRIILLSSGNTSEPKCQFS